MPVIDLPGGGTAEFPDDLPKEKIEAALNQYYGRDKLALSLGRSESPQDNRPSKGMGELFSDLVRGIGHDFGAGHPGIKQAIGKPAQDIAEGAKGMTGDFFRSLLPGRGGAQAGGRVVGKVGDILGFATGGGIGLEGPPTARPMPRMPQAAVGLPLSRGQQTLADFQQLGMRPNVPALAQSKPAQAVFSPARAISGLPVEKGLEANVAQAGQAAARVADQFNPAVNAEQAGRTAQDAIKAFAEDRTQADADYGEFYRLMHGMQPIDVPNTVSALRAIRGNFPNAPRLQQLFSNPKLNTMLTALELKATRVEPQVGGLAGANFAIPGGTITMRPKLSIPEMRELHTRVRYMLHEPSLGPDMIPHADLLTVYNALGQDLKRAARIRGPEAIGAMERADANYKGRAQIIEKLQAIAGAESPEKAFARLNAAARGTSTSDVGLLETARGVIPPQQWNDLGSAMIRRLGYAEGKEALPSEFGPDFSLRTFKSNWDKISPKAKDLLFGPYRSGTPRDTLETLSRVGANKALQTSPGSVTRAGMSGAAYMIAADHLVMSLMRGRFPWGEALGLGGLYGLARGLMDPRVAQWLYRERMVRQPPMGIPGAGLPQQLQRAGQAGFAVSNRRRLSSSDLPDTTRTTP